MQAPPPPHTSSTRMWRTKFGLRLASILFLIIIVSVGGSLASNPRVDFSLVMLLAVLPAFAPTFIWDIAECISLWVRAGHRGIHPGAVVAVDLLAWMGWVIVGLLMGSSGLIRNPYDFIAYYDNNGDYISAPNNRSPEDVQLAAQISSKSRAMFAFICLTVIVHFVLFVIGCYETNVRNRTPRTVYVMQPFYGPPGTGPDQYYQLGSLVSQAQQPDAKQGQSAPHTPTYAQPPPASYFAQPPVPHAAGTGQGHTHVQVS